MRDYAGGLPAWVNEGVAEYYSTFEMTNKDREFEIGRTISKHISMMNGNAFIPLPTLFTVDHGSPYYNEAERQGIFYSQSWALIHYLMLGNKTRSPQFLKFLSLMTSEKLVVEMFSDAFQIDYTTLEAELREYVRRRGSLPSMKLVLRDPMTIDREMTAIPLSEAQAEYYLGDLLYHSQRLTEAEAHLQKAIMLDPTLGSAYASMGMVRLAQKQSNEAVTLLKRAVAADPENHLVHYYYARMLDQLDREDSLPDEEFASWHETMRTHLTKSIELYPDFLESYKRLASLNLSTGEQLDGTEALLRNALSKASGRQDLVLLLAQTMLRTNKSDGARAILVPLARGGNDPEVQKQSELVLKNLDLYSGDRDAIRESLARREIVEERKEEPPSQISRRVPAQRTQRESVVEPINPITRVVDGEQISGLLVLMDCSSGLTLEVVTDQQTVQLHTDAPGNIEFISYISGVSSNVTCGRQEPAKPVRITYQKETREPTVVEFIEKN
jgi:tetratricopeptide (TPR) repeat protein